MKKIIIIAMVAVILLGGAAAAYFLFIAPGSGDPADKPVVLYSYSVGEAFVTNIKESNHHVKVNIILEYSGDEAKGVEILDKDQYKIRDKIISVLRDIYIEDFLGENGQELIKRNILTKLRADLGLEIIQAVYLIDFVVQ